MSFKRIVRLFASLKTAVLVLSVLAVVSTVGTIIESRTNSETASELVYHSAYMWLPLLLLGLILLAVMIDRWPWRKNHLGFLLAHSGIIMLLIGAVVTQKMGIDGNVRIPIQGTESQALVPEFQLRLFKLGKTLFTRLYEKDLPRYLSTPPTQESPDLLYTPIGIMKVEEFYPYAAEEEKIVAAPTAGPNLKTPALRLSIENLMAQSTEWLWLDTSEPFTQKSLGPMTLILASAGLEWTKENQWQFSRSDDPKGEALSSLKNTSGLRIVFSPQSAETFLNFWLFNKDNQIIRTGKVSAGEKIETEWMGTLIRVLKYLPEAERISLFTPLSRPNERSTSALRVRFKEKDYWVGKESFVKIIDGDTIYALSYGRKRVELGFTLTLEDFQIGRYEGTRMAKSYESQVKLADGSSHLISMNEPLKYQGYTFYQASFEENQMGEPQASILSVNWDPGRPLKYGGSLLIVAGSVVMALMKRRRKVAPS